MFLFLEGIFALGILPLLVIAAFLIAMVVGVTFDRRDHREDAKWWIFGIGFAALTVYGFVSLGWSIEGVWNTVRDWAFWKPFAMYLVFGLVYTAVEFFFDVRRSAKFYRDEWQKHLKDTTRVGRGVDSVERKIADIYRDAQVEGAETATAESVANSFVARFEYKDRIINLKVAGDKITPEPVVNKVELAEHIGAWSLFWPFYLVSLVLGDLLTEVFRIVADILVNLTGRFVKLSFADVFKLN